MLRSILLALLLPVAARADITSPIFNGGTVKNMTVFQSSVTSQSSMTVNGQLSLASGATVLLGTNGVYFSTSNTATTPAVFISSMNTPFLKIGTSTQTWTPGYCVHVDTISSSDSFGVMNTTTSRSGGIVVFASVTIPSGTMNVKGYGVHFLCTGQTIAAAGGQIYGCIGLNGVQAGDCTPHVGTTIAKPWHIEGDLVFLQNQMISYHYGFYYNNSAPQLSDGKISGVTGLNTNNSIVLTCMMNDNFSNGSDVFGFFRVCNH